MSMILVVDFGSQTTHLIGRRIKEYGATAEIILLFAYSGRETPDVLPAIDGL